VTVFNYFKIIDTQIIQCKKMTNNVPAIQLIAQQVDSPLSCSQNWGTEFLCLDIILWQAPTISHGQTKCHKRL